ncbi:Mediator of RNA polymerase II transcription subunit 18 [Arachnomyces sp. PD_36]|nr:Mediator of RNA polymerase II transcription subunit 18 [Arachnomyces sp. PD_36]
MHELLLFASIPAKQHHDLLQQLAGLTAMQPNRVLERHLIFRAHRKPGYTNTFRSGGSQDVHAAEMQKLNKQLNGGLFFTQVVGEVRGTDFGAKQPSTQGSDVTMTGTDGPRVSQQLGGGDSQDKAGYDFENQGWKMEFRDIPEAGTRTAVTSRLMGMATIPRGDVVAVMDSWGYDYISEYIIEGNTFILDDIVIFLHRVLNFPATDGQEDPKTPRQHLPPLEELQPLDPSGSYVLQTAITVQDSGNPDLLRAASQHLLELKERLKAVVKLEPADRLALDTRAK